MMSIAGFVADGKRFSFATRSNGKICGIHGIVENRIWKTQMQTSFVIEK